MDEAEHKGQVRDGVDDSPSGQESPQSPTRRRQYEEEHREPPQGHLKRFVARGPGYEHELRNGKLDELVEPQRDQVRGGRQDRRDAQSAVQRVDTGGEPPEREPRGAPRTEDYGTGCGQKGNKARRPYGGPRKTDATYRLRDRLSNGGRLRRRRGSVQSPRQRDREGQRRGARALREEPTRHPRSRPPTQPRRRR